MQMKQGNPQQTVLAYLAGIIDGEGCIRLAKNCSGNKRISSHTANVNCGMTNPIAVEMLHQIFGGSIRDVQPTCKNASPCKPLRYWYASGTDSVARVLLALYPYLRVKKKQAAIVLDFCFNKRDGRQRGGLTQDERRWREDLYWQVRELNRRGVAATTNSSGPEKVCDSLNQQETVGGGVEESHPLVSTASQ